MGTTFHGVHQFEVAHVIDDTYHHAGKEYSMDENSSWEEYDAAELCVDLYEFGGTLYCDVRTVDEYTEQYA